MGPCSGPSKSLALLPALERAATGLVGGRRGGGSLRGAARCGNETGGADRLAALSRNFADRAFGSGDALRRRRRPCGGAGSRFERMIGRQVRRDRGARRRVRFENLADRARRHGDGRRLRLYGLEFARRGGEMLMGRRGIWQFGLRLRRHRHAGRRRWRRNGFRRRRHLQLRCSGQGARGAEITFDHGEPIDHMAERAVDGFQRNPGCGGRFPTG